MGVANSLSGVFLRIARSLAPARSYSLDLDEETVKAIKEATISAKESGQELTDEYFRELTDEMRKFIAQRTKELQRRR